MDIQGAVNTPAWAARHVSEQQTSQRLFRLDAAANKHFSGGFLPRAVTPLLQVVSTEKENIVTTPLALYCRMIHCKTTETRRLRAQVSPGHLTPAHRPAMPSAASIIPGISKVTSCLRAQWHAQDNLTPKYTSFSLYEALKRHTEPQIPGMFCAFKAPLKMTQKHRRKILPVLRKEECRNTLLFLKCVE